MPNDVPAPSSSPTDVRRELEAELEREDREVLYPLLDRITELSELLAQRKFIDPEYIVEAIHLWRRYVDELHQTRIRRLFLLLPPVAQLARSVARRGHRLAALRRRLSARRRAEEAPVETSETVYAEIRKDQQRMGERIGVLESLVEVYRKNEYFAPELLASLLRSGAFADRAWARYEEEFALRYLDTHLPDATAAEIRTGTAAADQVRSAVEDEVRAFLARPVPIRAPST